MLYELFLAVALRYAVNDCAQLLNLETGETDPAHVMRVEKITSKRYYYRWHLDNGNWAYDLDTGIGEHKVFEENTMKVECPK